MKKKINIIGIILLLSTCFVATSCDKPKTCGVGNPLTDLPWLKAEIDEIILSSQQGNSLRIAIYQCIYSDKRTGFLIDKGNIKPFYNCNGDILCTMGGYAGETCSELNIVSQELIWGINN